MARLHVTIRVAERDVREGRTPSFAAAEKTAQVVAAAERQIAMASQARTPAKGQALGVALALPEEDGPQGGVCVRLRVHDRDRGWEH